MSGPTHVRLGTRLRVLGYLALWLLEMGAQAGRLLQFLARRRQIRERMHRVILAGHGPDRQTLEQRPPGSRQVRMKEEDPAAGPAAPGKEPPA